MFILFAISGTQAGDTSPTNNDFLIAGPKKKAKPPEPEKREPDFDGFQKYEGSSQEVKSNSNLAYGTLFDFNPVLGDRQMERLLPHMKDEHCDRLSKYVEANKSNPGRFKFVQLGDEKSDVTYSKFLKSFSEEQSQSLEALERILSSDKESRELARVFMAMSFSVSNPKAAIAALGNLLSVLQTASAKQLASSSIADISAFAVRQALIKAKYDPKSDEAKQLSSILNSIASSVLSSGSLNSNSQPGQLGENIGDIANPSVPGTGNGNAGGAPNVNTEPRADRIVVVDTETGEIIDDIDVLYNEEMYADATVQVNQNVASNVQSAQGVASDGANAERRITDEKELQNKEVIAAREELTQLSGEKSNITSTETPDTGKLSVVENQIGAANRTIAIG